MPVGLSHAGFLLENKGHRTTKIGMNVPMGGVTSLWSCAMSAGSVFCISFQSDVVFACDVAEHLQGPSSSRCFA